MLVHIHKSKQNYFFFTIIKPIQQSYMVILSCLAMNNLISNSRKQSSGYYCKWSFVGISGLKTFSNKLHFYSLSSNFDFVFVRQLRMNISNCYISFKIVKKIGCVGSCGYATAFVKLKR